MNTKHEMAARLAKPMYSVLFLCLTVIFSVGCDSGPESLNMVADFSWQEIPASMSLSFQTSLTGPAKIIVSLDSADAELELFTQVGDQELLASRVPYNRGVPIYQVLELKPGPNEIGFEILARQKTKDAKVRLSLFGVSGDSINNKNLIRAFQLYTEAIRSTNSEAIETWAPRVGYLQESATLFKESAMPMEALWSEYLAAYFLYFPVSKYDESVEVSTKVHERAAAAGFTDIVIAALQLRGFALIERTQSDSPEQAVEKFELAQEIFDEAVVLATDQEKAFDQAWAINAKGIGRYYQDKLQDALTQYSSALQIAELLGDRYFTNQIRGNIALVLEKSGREVEALTVLGEIEASFGDEDGGHIVLDNLIEQGRIYKNFFRFSEAITALNRALEYAEDIEDLNSIGRIRISIAEAYYEMGLMDRALLVFQQAEADLLESNFGGGLRQVYRGMANIHRHRGEFELMRHARAKQSNFITSDLERAYFLYNMAKDLRADEPDSTLVYEHLLASLQQAEHIRNRTLQQLLRLEICLASLNGPERGPDCDMEMLKVDFTDLLNGQMPRQALSGMELWADILIASGRLGDARSVLDELVERVAVYRAKLPGVLGAWYWERRRKLFDTYMHLLVDQGLDSGDGAESLATFDRLRNLEFSGSGNPSESSNADSVGIDEIRSMIAVRNGASSQEDSEKLARAFDELRLKARETWSYTTMGQSTAWLSSVLEKLPDGHIVLAYYMPDDDIFVWRGDRFGVTLKKLDPNPELRAELELMVVAIRANDNDRFQVLSASLGGSLLSALEGDEQVISLLSAGPLNGFPFDMLQLNGNILAKKQTVVNLMSLEGLIAVQRNLASPEEVFLAGQPEGMVDFRPELSSAGTELEYVAQTFPNSKISVSRGVDLKLEQFQSAAYQSADIVHIASHGHLDLEYPSLSTISLSSGLPEPSGPGFLTPLDVERVPISSALVVLSACETSGLSDFDFDGNLGFVTSFLIAGATTVVASLWPVSDRLTADFMGDFYTNLAHGLSSEEALYSTKRKWIEQGSPQAKGVWGAFQLFRN